MGTDTITVVGGGIGGLVAAIAAAEQGVAVRLHEAAPILGGRARTSEGDFRANLGPHVIYDDGTAWAWLDARGLARPAARLPLGSVRFLVGGEARRLPPRRLVAALARHRRTSAPDDVDARTWLRERTDPGTAELLCAAAGVATFHHDPGQLAASFVWERLVRATGVPPAVRYVPGGWSTLAQRLAARARRLGVAIETSSRIDALPPGPTILAVPLRVGAGLLGDDRVARAAGTGTRTALLDIGLRRDRHDPFIVSDLDGGGWMERFSAADRTLAPAGHDLIQVQVGVDHDDLEAGVATCERILDASCRDWRGREVWRRRSIVADSSGAVDGPGTTWRDRPAIAHSPGTWLVGDEVAAPGLLSEVSVASAVAAAAEAVATVTRPVLSTGS